MTNFDKYKDTLVDIMKEGTSFALDKDTGLPVACSTNGIPCTECGFNTIDFECPRRRKEWLEATVYDGEIPVDAITNTISEDLKNAIRAFYKARHEVCASHDCYTCELKNDNWCYEISQMEALFYIFGPSLAKEAEAALLKWYDLVKEFHPEYLK